MKYGLGMPITEDFPGEVGNSLLTLGVQFGRMTVGNDLVIYTPHGVKPHDRARQSCVDYMLAAEVDVLFFFDSDMIFPNHAVSTLLSTFRETGAQAVSGHYYRRGYPYTSVWSKKLPDSDTYTQVNAPHGVHEIDFSGLGCAVIDLNWVKKNMTRPYFSMLHTEDGTVVADDVTFFKKIGELGGKIVGDANVRCKHLGARVMIDDGNADYLRKEDLHAQFS